MFFGAFLVLFRFFAEVSFFTLFDFFEGLVFIAGKFVWGVSFWILVLLNVLDLTVEMLKTHLKLLNLLNKNTLINHNCLKLCSLIDF